MGCSGCNAGVAKHHTRKGSNAPSIAENFPHVDLEGGSSTIGIPCLILNVYVKVVKFPCAYLIIVDCFTD